ncbi:MAG: LysM peptidoglycan-binding domain-containing protein [bacterium]
MYRFLAILLVVILLPAFALSQDWKALKEETKGKDIKALTQQLLNEANNFVTKSGELKAANSELESKIQIVRKIQDFYKTLYAEDEKYLSPGAHDIYVVKPGDWLSKLAEYPEVYGWGNYARWPDIYHANTDLIKDPDLIYPGWELKIPRP